jgi:hypothetical protein
MRLVTRFDRKRRGAFMLLLLSPLLAFGPVGCAGRGSGLHRGSLTPAEKMMWSTYAVGTRRGLATGFVVSRKDAQAPGGRAPVVVTSAHLLESAPRGPFYLALRLPGQDGNPQVAVLELQPVPSAAPVYVRHPRYDVAALEVRLPPDIARQVPLPTFLEEEAIGRQADRPRAGQDVSLLGFPYALPGSPGGFPVLRGGRIASYSVAGPAGAHAFLIHTDVYPGDSGGPVFVARAHGPPTLVGMVTRRVGQDARAAVALAVAVDARAIRETLRQLAERERGQGN